MSRDVSPPSSCAEVIKTNTELATEVDIKRNTNLITIYMLQVKKGKTNRKVALLGKAIAATPDSVTCSAEEKSSLKKQVTVLDAIAKAIETFVKELKEAIKVSNALYIDIYLITLCSKCFFFADRHRVWTKRLRVGQCGHIVDDEEGGAQEGQDCQGFARKDVDCRVLGQECRDNNIQQYKLDKLRGQKTHRRYSILCDCIFMYLNTLYRGQTT